MLSPEGEGFKTGGLETVLISTKSEIRPTDMVRRLWRKIHSPIPTESNRGRGRIPRDKNLGKIRGIFGVFSAGGTASLIVVAEGEKLEKTLLEVDFRPSP